MDLGGEVGPEFCDGGAQVLPFGEVLSLDTDGAGHGAGGEEGGSAEIDFAGGRRRRSRPRPKPILNAR